MEAPTTETPEQEQESQPSAETPNFSLFFAGVDPAELGDPIGVQELYSRLHGFEQHVNEQLAELREAQVQDRQDVSARFAAFRQGISRATGVDPLA